MRLLAVMLFALLPGAAGQSGLGLISNVYLLPMGNGFDQYLASHLTSLGVFRVVTDPQKADAVFTDQIGETFSERLAQLYPPPPPPKVEKEEDEEDSKEAKKDEKRPVRSPSFGRGRGTLFLVDRKTRDVIWSVLDTPKNSTTRELSLTAERIARRLKKEAIGK